MIILINVFSQIDSLSDVRVFALARSDEHLFHIWSKSRTSSGAKKVLLKSGACVGLESTLDILQV